MPAEPQTEPSTDSPAPTSAGSSALLEPSLASHRHAEHAVPFSLRVAAGIGWRLIIVAVVLWGVLQILAATKTVAIPVSIGLLLTALAMPLMVLLNHRLGLKRHLAAAITTLGGLGIVIGLLALAGNQLVAGFADLSGQLGTGIQQIQNWLAQGPFAIGSEQINQAITAGQNWVRQNATQLTSGALSAGSTATEVLVGAVIALICMFFFLAEGDSIWSFFVRMMPRPIQMPVHEGFRRGWVSLGSYVKTQVLVAFIDAVFISVGAFLLGLPLVIPLGLIIFFASSVPIVGAVVSGALAVVLALVVQGPGIALAMLAVVISVQQLESQVLQPVLMGKAVSVHPLAVLLGVAVFSFLFGVVGALFAVPVIAVTNTVIQYWTGHDKFPLLAEGASAVGEAPKKLVGHDKDDPDQGQKGAQQKHQRIGGVSPFVLRRKADNDDQRSKKNAKEQARQENLPGQDTPEKERRR